MTARSYLSPANFRIFAHRGTTELGATENTIQAFVDAIDCGAHYLETDVQATRDSQVVIFHDDNLKRLLGVNKRISDLLLTELQSLAADRGIEIPTLEQALTTMASCKFNIDIKSLKASMSAASVIRKVGAVDRVLVSSFSKRRRVISLSTLPEVATSADSSRVFQLLFGLFLRMDTHVRKALSGLDAVQIPTHLGPIRLDTQRLIETCHSHGVEVHYWTINELDDAKRLRALGADGIVTDRCKLMAKELAE